MAFELTFILSLLLSCLASCARSQQHTYIWLEAEKPAEANFDVKVSKGPQGDLLSGGAWLVETLSKGEVASGKLGSGRWLKYRFTVRRAGKYALWIRLGFEFVRPPINWRIDGGEWRRIEPTDLTVNLIELGFWCEAGWLKAGDVNLSKGAHVIEIVARQPGRDGRFLLALDAIAFVMGDWTPEDKLKPGEFPNEEIDRKAAAHIFKFTHDDIARAKRGKRITLSLNGLWQVCRHDDTDMDRAPYEPVRDFPKHPRWRGIEVPSDLWSIPALRFAHRVWYRCRVDVPRELIGRSFILDFTGTNWIASVVVNGEFIGWRKSTRIPWHIDITRAIKAGVNEIRVGIKDVWYAIDAKFHNSTLDGMRNRPPRTFRWTRFIAPVYPSTKGDADGRECGITDPVALIVAGAVYVDDVFIRTSVARKSIAVDVTLRNSMHKPVRTALRADAIFERTGDVEKRLGRKTVTVPAMGTAMVHFTTSWSNPKLWFPDDDPANLYRLVSTVSIDGRCVDVHEERFGFREVTIDGIYIRINGIRRNFWNLLGSLTGKWSHRCRTPGEMLAHFRKGNNRFERFSEDLNLRKFFGPRRNRLEWFDEHGIAGRLSTMIDGMFINYDLTNPLVWENFREHVRQVVLAYRNHPSIIVWSLENELVLINGMLGYRRILDRVEAEAKRLVDVANELDPTRPCMLDGAGALKGHVLNINCLHYPEPATEFYPENAYTLEQWGRNVGPGGRWIWRRKRPLAMGEIAFFSGRNSRHAWIGGDSVFRGRYYAKRAYAKFVRCLIEGYRWNDVAIICPWIHMDDFPECWKSMSALAVFVREYNSSFFGGEKVERTVKVFNDTFSHAPVTFTWAVEMNGKRIAGATHALKIAPGFGREFKIEFTAPMVKTRTDAQLILQVTRKGERTFRDVKSIAFFPRIATVRLTRHVFVIETEPTLSRRLAMWGIKARSVRSIAQVTVPNAIVIIAPNHLKREMRDEILAFARGGGRVICLEQDEPLSGFGAPMPLTATQHQANYTFPQVPQGIEAPLFAGLREGDFSNWAGDAPTAKRVWEMPTGSVRSWVACGEHLRFSCMIEAPCDKGVIIASQLRIGAKLDIEPVAQRLLANMLRYCDAYRPPTRRTLIHAPQMKTIVNFIRRIGVKAYEAQALSDALSERDAILVVHASRRNLMALLRMRNAVNEFVNRGGWIMLWGLEPDGLDAFNALLGTRHLIREFRLERPEIVPDALTAGLGNRDVVQYSTEELMHRDRWLSMDTFTYCVDGADIAPFCHLPYQREGQYRPLKNDKDPFNLVNGMTGHDFWRYILQIWYGDWKRDSSPPFTFRLPIPCRIRKVRIWNNTYYDNIADLEIRVDGKHIAKVTLPDEMASAEIDLSGVLVHRNISFVVRSIRKRQGRLPLVGIDNVQIIRELPDWYAGRVYPLVNIGALVKYPRGNGGFILNQLKLTKFEADDRAIKRLNRRDREIIAENVGKKERIVSIILHNLGAVVAN